MSLLNIKESQRNKITKLDLLIFFEREVDRFQNIIGYNKEQADNIKLDIALMIKTGDIDENTIADKELIKRLL